MARLDHLIQTFSNDSDPQTVIAYNFRDDCHGDQVTGRETRRMTAVSRKGRECVAPSPERLHRNGK